MISSIAPFFGLVFGRKAMTHNVWQRNAVVFGAKKNIHRSNRDYQPAPKTIERPL
jgi:hypothetical protein